MSSKTDQESGRDEIRRGFDGLPDLFDLTLDGLYLVAADTGRVVDANASACRVLGYDLHELLDMHVWDFSGLVSDRERWEALLPSFIGNQARSFEDTHRCRDGSVVPVEIKARHLDGPGRGLFLSVVRDISERKAAERSVREAGQRYDAILKSTTDGFWVVDLSGRLLDVNDAYCRYSGYNREQLLEKHVWDLDVEDRQEDVEARIERVIGNEGAIFETLHRRRDGLRWPVEVSISHSHIDGGRVFCFFRDITERKDRERELEGYRIDLESLVAQRTRDIEKQKTAFETLFEKSPNGELIIENGRFVQCNEKVLEILGHGDKSDFLPCEPAGLSPPTQPDGENSADKAARMIELATRNGGHRFEWVHSRTDGSSFWCEVNLTPLSLPGRENLLFVAWRDMSEQKEIERSLHKARELAEAATELKSQFLANMSHEIRTPMNAVIGMINLALQSGLDPLQSGYISKAGQAANDLLGILNDILDLSRIEAGKLTLTRKPFEPEKLIEHLVDLLSIKAEEKSLDFSYAVEPSVPGALLGDSMRINQVLVNLVSNAIKFTDPGDSIRVVVAVEKISGDTVMLSFSVTDTGIGIHPDDIDRLFKPFTQIDGSSDRKYSGAGLGLAISSQLVRAMGGELAAESAPGVDSTFRFTLPLQRVEDSSRAFEHGERSEEGGRDVERAIARLRGARILVVEDNELNLEVTRELLHLYGMHVESAGNGAEALDLLARHRFDGVLMDCQMPVMDGYEATRRIRRIREFDSLPVIAMTANTMKGDTDKVLEVGMSDHIPKPIDPDNMLLTMARWIRSESPQCEEAADVEDPADDST